MNILFTGASGFIGQNLSQMLTDMGHRVIPVSRKNGLNFSAMQTAGDWLPHLQGIDAVINAVGIIAEQGEQRFDVVHTQAPKALFQACAQAGVRRVIQISALGADEQSSSAYHLSKRAADEYLRSLDLDWFVLRPSLVYGRGGASAGLFMQLAALPLISVIGDGQQRIQPVHISDLVAAVVQCLVSEQVQMTLDVVGPEIITFIEWLQLMRRAQGFKPARIIHVPFRLAMLGAQLGRYLSPLLQPDNLRMLQAGNFADAEPLSQFLGRKPLALAPELFFSNLLVGANI
jgi:uncharacterized protein YbjT (DUF2867 family)